MRKIDNFQNTAKRLIDAVHNYRGEPRREGVGAGLTQFLHAQLGLLVHVVQKTNPDWQGLTVELRSQSEEIDHALYSLGAFFKNEKPTNEEKLTAGIFAKFIHHYGHDFVEKWQACIPIDEFEK